MVFKSVQDLQKDKWTNQKVDVSQFNFEAVLGKNVMMYVYYTANL